MATPTPQTLAMTCPKCGAGFRLATEMAGKKGRCAKCGEVFRVAGAPPAKPLPQPVAAPQLIAVHCRVCQTLMYGRLDEVGKPIKCPDCYAQTIVPPPPVVKPSKPMAAMEGEQYELWGVDESPTVAQMLAAQPKYIAIECHLCRTLMHAKPEQVGKKLKCPDCGAATLVTPPEAPAKIPNVLSRDEDDLLIDTTRDPGERPAVIVPPRKPMLYEEEAEAERKQREERRARGDTRGPQYDVKGRAVMPRFPLITRIFSFMLSRGVVVRWVSLTMAWFVVVSPMWLAAQTQLGVIAALPMSFFTMFALAVWTAAVAAIAMAIIVESSEGNDEVAQWPTTNPIDWVGEFLYMLLAGVVSPLPGALIGRMFPDPATQALLFVGSVLICMPIAILSQLDVGSAFAIASPRVIASLVRAPGSWLTFYCEIALTWLTCLGITLAAEHVPYLVVLLVPLYVGAVLLSARILGRLAWAISEKMATAEAEERD